MSDYKNVFTLDTNFSKYGLILVNPAYFRKQTDYTDMTITILDVVSKALLKSQKSNRNEFDIIIYGRGLKLGQIDLSFVKYLINILNEYFPDKLGKCYIVNSSNIMKNFVKIIKSFLDRDGREKIKLIKDINITSLNESFKILL